MPSIIIEKPSASELAENANAGSDVEKDANEPNETKLEQVFTREDGVEYPTGVRLGLVMLALCLAVFLLALVCPRP
jgi:hypothetical protein